MKIKSHTNKTKRKIANDDIKRSIKAEKGEKEAHYGNPSTEKSC